MLRCPSCKSRFEEGGFCPGDGSRLEPEDDPNKVPINQRVTVETEVDALIGRVLDGRYRIDEKLGEGGMGAVYRATHLLMDKKLAIKVLRGPVARDPAATRRFQREAKSASRLDHEHCIRVTDFGQSEDALLYLVMEYLEGKTLGEELHAIGPLPPVRAARIARRVASALAHAHDLNVIHRDLKPDNIFLTTRDGDEDWVKVLDFGLAKLLAPETDPGTGRATYGTLTESGSVFGTPEYMSPEQAEGRALDTRTDLYSLGILTYQMLTGLLPFQAASFMGTLTKHLTEHAQPPDERRPDLGIPASLSAIVMGCLEKDPARRPADARTLAKAIEEADLSPPPPRVRRTIAGLPTQQVELDSRPPTAGAQGRRLWTGVAVALATLILAAGAVLVVRSWRRSHAALASADAATASARVAPAPPDAAPRVVQAPADAAPVAAGPDAEPRGPEARETAADHLKLARGFRQKGNPIKELFHLQRAVALEPRNADALFELGQVLVEGGQKDRGCRYLRRAFALPSARTLYDKVGCGLVE